MRSFTNSNLTDEGLVRWSLTRGGHLREVVAQGGSTVVTKTNGPSDKG